MAVPLTYSGNDENALETLVADAGLAFTHAGNTHQAIDALADLAAVDLTNLQGNDRWMLEQLAAAATAAYVFKLDDDGTVATLFGKPWLETIAPDYMSFTRAMGQGGQGYAAASAQTLTDDGSFPLVPGAVVVVGEYLVTAASPITTNQKHGLAIAITNAGTPTGIITAALMGEGTGIGKIYIEVNSAPVSTDPIGATTLIGERIGVYIDGTTGQMGITSTDLGDMGPITGAIVAAGRRYSPGLFVDDSDLGALGDTLAGSFFMDAADLACTYPVGTIDRNGVAV